MKFYTFNLFNVIVSYFHMILKYRSFKVEFYVSSFEENGFQPYFMTRKNKYFNLIPINGIKLEIK